MVGLLLAAAIAGQTAAIAAVAAVPAAAAAKPPAAAAKPPAAAARAAPTPSSAAGVAKSPPPAGPRIARLKPQHRQTPLTSGGKPRAVILAPDTPAGRRAAAAVAARVKTLAGAELPVVHDLARADLRRTHVVAMGNVLDNPLIERLYWNRYSPADRLFPGPGKYALRTVCNPYPFVGGYNAFLVEASDDAGLTAGGEALAARIAKADEVVLPWTLVVSDFEPLPPKRRPPSAAVRPADVNFYTFQSLAQAWLKRPDPTVMVRIKEILRQLAALYDQDPKRHLTWPEETNSEWIAPCWDAIEESDDFTDAERFRYTNLMLLVLHAQPQHIYEYAALERSTSITWNHITFPLLGLYFSARYFRAYYPEVDRKELDVYFEKIEACFRGQQRCWKPREDSAGYTAITPRHIIAWELAEGRRGWIDAGFARDLADYLFACGDPMGYSAGHGDFPGARSSSDERSLFPLLYYIGRDPRVLWRLNQLSGGDWPNPFWSDVRPAPPDDHLGVRVVPMHPEYYRWSDNLPFYGTQPAPHNVPLTRSFDKLSLRTGLEPADPYLLVDGFGRGYHLHYDTNMIIKYTRHGQVLLMDADYLVRNTTEHSGLSVIRDGRAESHVPALAAVEATATLPHTLAAQASVADYNGVDWRRTILMPKDGPVAVFDEAAARRAGDYSFWLVWKTLNEGDPQLAGRAFQARYPGRQALPTPGLGILASAEAAGGEALVFAEPRARLVLELDMPAGRYSFKIRARGENGANDSIFIEAVGREPPRPMGVTPGGWVVSNFAWNFGPPKGPTERQTLVFRLRESPGFALDTIAIHGPDGKPLVDARAIDLAVPGGGRIRVPDHHFYIVPGGRPAVSLSPRTSANGEPVIRLRQIAAARLSPSSAAAAGSRYVFQNLLASVLDDRTPPAVRRIDDDTFVASAGGEEWLFGVGRPQTVRCVGGLEIAAAGFVFGKGRLALVEATRVVVDGRTLFESKTPRSVELPCPVPAVLRQAEPPAAATVESQPPAWPARWTFRPQAAVYRDGPEFLEAADLDGDGDAELLYGVGNVLYVLAGGTPRWSYTAPERVRSCTVADLDVDGAAEVLLGAADGMVRVLDARGREQRKWHCDVELVSGQGHGRTPSVTALAAADLDGDGPREVLAGTWNCWLLAYTAQGKELWRESKQYHGVRRILVHDIDADGAPEVFSANRYGGLPVYTGMGQDGRGKLLWNLTSELGDVSATIGRLRRDGSATVVNGSSTGALVARRWKQPAADFQFPNHGFGVNEVSAADLDADGLDELLVASDTGRVYALDGGGAIRWQTELKSVVRDVAAGQFDGRPGWEVLGGGEDGSAWLLDQGGKVRAVYRGPAAALQTLARRNSAGSAAVVAFGNGQLVELKPPP